MRMAGDVGLLAGALASGALAEITTLGTSLMANGSFLLAATAWFV